MDDQAEETTAQRTWTERYGEKHRWRRFQSWLPGIAAPVKVRVYERAGRYLLNFWDPTAGKNLSERIDGDLLAALTRARLIDERILNFRSTGGAVKRKLGHAELVASFLADVTRRVDAKLAAVATLNRYRAALDHYLAWCHSPAAEKKHPHAANVNREFRLGLSAFLASRMVCGNGRRGPARLMQSHGYVLDVARAMFEWAADPNRGNLMPEGFRNPFLGGGEQRPVFVGDPLTAPKISMPMAAEFLAACSLPEKKLFAPIILFGLRASEPCYLFREHLSLEWLEVPNIDDLDYFTKGRRGKRFPWVSELAVLREQIGGDRDRGLLYRRNDFLIGRMPTTKSMGLREMAEAYHYRIAAANQDGHRGCLKIRKQLFREQGALAYDDIETLFHCVTSKLGWKTHATLKDFRHLFATTLSDANISEGYRRYLLGHAPGREAAVAYTHLHRLKEQFAAVLRTEFAPVLRVLPETSLAAIHEVRPDK